MGKRFRGCWILLVASSLLAAVAQPLCSPKTIRIALVCALDGTPLDFCEEQREAVIVRVKQQNERLAAAGIPLTVATSYRAEASAALSRVPFLLMQSATPPDAIIGLRFAQGSC